jgi:hypothetical protein
MQYLEVGVRVSFFYYFDSNTQAKKLKITALELQRFVILYLTF